MQTTLALYPLAGRLGWRPTALRRMGAGMFLGAVGAGPVYRLLGKKDLGTDQFPPMETALIDGDIAFRQHSDGHTTGPNWPTFLAFAARYIQGPT